MPSRLQRLQRRVQTAKRPCARSWQRFASALSKNRSAFASDSARKKRCHQHVAKGPPTKRSARRANAPSGCLQPRESQRRRARALRGVQQAFRRVAEALRFAARAAPKQWPRAPAHPPRLDRSPPRGRSRSPPAEAARRGRSPAAGGPPLADARARSATARASASRARPAAGTIAASGSSSRRVFTASVNSFFGGV